MKTQNEIERLADEALKSIDGILPVEANNFLFTRIESRLAMGDQQQNFAAAKYLSRLSVALVLFIGLNVGTYYLLSPPMADAPIAKQKTSSAAEALASEYNLSTNQYNY